MRVYLCLVLAACSSSAQPAPKVASPPRPPLGAANKVESPAPAPIEAPQPKLAQDTQTTTAAGNTFVAPAGWTLRARPPGTILESPEGGSFIAIYDLADAKDADSAVARAWALYKGKAPFPLIDSRRSTTDVACGA